MLLIAGLGNPGQKYEKNRHNVGFMAVDAIHRHESFSPWKVRFQALTSEGAIGGKKVLLVKPNTFMNESGRAVGEAVRFYKLAPSDVIALYDELDLAPGKVRIKVGGGAGGHNGIRSIDAHLGKDYRRVRIGIGHPGSKERVHGHVLGDFARSDYIWLDPLLDEMGRHADLLVKGEDSSFMNKLALALGDEPPKSGGGKPKPKNQSHIRQARQNVKKPKSAKDTSQKDEPSGGGPMADILRKLLGDK